MTSSTSESSESSTSSASGKTAKTAKNAVPKEDPKEDPSRDALDLLRGAEDALNAMTSSMQSMSRKLLDLVDAASEGSKREEDLQSQLSAAQQRVAQTRADLSALLCEREADAAALQRHQEDIAALHQQQEDVAARLADARHELQDSRHELQDARHDLLEAREALQETRDQLASRNNDCEELRASSLAALEEAARCRAGSIDELASLKEELSRETARVTELEALNAGLKSVSRMVSLQNENERLREELRSLGAGPAGRLRVNSSSSAKVLTMTSQPSA